jgi:hypothetical protein
MITEPFSLAPYLVGATAPGLGYIQVIMRMHVAGDKPSSVGIPLKIQVLLAR